MTNTKRRRTVEIYFVLYLAALVFLLPNGKEDGSKLYDGKGTLAYLPFTLMPQKTTLNCRMEIDSTGEMRIKSLDSMNTIVYTGDVQDVKFEFIIEDQSLRQSLSLKAEERPITKYFRVEEHPDRQAATFFWLPPMSEDRQSKSYLVRVIATIRPKLNDTSFARADNETLDRQTFKLQTKFSLNVIIVNDFINAPFASRQGVVPNIPEDARGFLDPPYQSMKMNPTGDFSLDAGGDVSQMALTTWRKTIRAVGLDLKKDIIGKPEISVRPFPEDNHGEAGIVGGDEGQIVLAGKTPNSGSMKVSVKVKRKYDNREYTTDFMVTPIKIFRPDFPQRMYPEMSYKFDPHLPLTNANTWAVLKEKDGGEVRKKSNQGEPFTFSPSISDTGKEFLFETYVDNNLIESNNLRVISFNNPIVKDIQYLGNGRAKVVTTSHGTYNKEKNIVISLVISGNARIDHEDFGNFGSKDMFQTQNFIIVQSDPTKPFSFTAVAVDRRGRKSQVKPFMAPGS